MTTTARPARNELRPAPHLDRQGVPTYLVALTLSVGMLAACGPQGAAADAPGVDARHSSIPSVTAMREAAGAARLPRRDPRLSALLVGTSGRSTSSVGARLRRTLERPRTSMPAPTQPVPRLAAPAPAVGSATFQPELRQPLQREGLSKLGAPLEAPPVGGEMGTEGGLVRVDDPSSRLHRAAVLVPAGAMADMRQLSIQGSSIPAPRGAAGLAVGPVVEFGPDGQQFINPARIALPYDAGMLAARGIQPAQLKVLYHNPASGRWEEVPGSDVDEANQVIWAPTLHFSTYVGGLPPAAPSIGGVTPPAAIAGRLIEISGANFELGAQDNTVTIGGQLASIDSVDTEEGNWIRVIVPAGMTSGDNDVTVETATFSGEPTTLPAAFNNLSSRAYVLNAFSNDVSLIDTVQGNVMTGLSVGVDPANGFPHDLAIREDGTEAYVVNLGEASVTIINGVARSVVTTLTLGGGLPAFAKLSPDQTLLAVGLDSSIALIDVDPASATRHQVVAQPSLNDGVLKMAFSDDSKRMYAPTAGTQHFYGVDTDRQSPAFGTVVLDLDTQTSGWSFEIAIVNGVAHVGDQGATITRVGVDPAQPETYHQQLPAIATAAQIGYIAADRASNRALCLWTGSDGQGHARSLRAADGSWNDDEMAMTLPITGYVVLGQQRQLAILQSDYDVETTDALTITAIDSMTVVKSLDPGPDAYDVAFAPNQGLYLVPGADTGELRLIAADGSGTSTLTAGAGPWRVAVVTEE